MANESMAPAPLVRRTEVTHDRLFAGYAKSPTVRQIWRDAYGDDFPENVEPLSYVTLTDLRRIASALGVGPSATLVDLGSGSGGPSLWVARQTGAQVVGIDVSTVGVAQANARAQAEGVADRVRFHVSDIATLPLPAASVDAAMSVDMLVFVPDIDAVMAEVARVLLPGARFAFTAREQHAASATFGSPARPDYRPALHAAGLVMETYEETPQWAERQRALLRAIAAAEAQLYAEMDAESAAEFMNWALGVPKQMATTRRVFGVARKP
jgi:ubiquinone/menaquinone biosynthesis C-methylase UbiE